MGVFFRIEVFIHELQYIFHTNLLGISHRPDGIELQTFRYGTLQDEYRCSTGTGNQIYAFRIQIGNRLAEYAVMPCVH